MIKAKRKKDEESLLRVFEQDADLQILNGRWGPYIKYKKKNYKIFKGTDVQKLSFEDCMKIVEAGGNKTKKAGGKKK